MRRLSIARVLTGTLVGIVLILAVITALGIAALYQVRQDYENQLSVTSGLQVAAANLVSAAIFENLEFRKPPGTRNARVLRRAQDADAAAALTALRLITGDPDGDSQRLLTDERLAEGAARALAAPLPTGGQPAI
jgi:hypothetical protein